MRPIARWESPGWCCLLTWGNVSGTDRDQYVMAIKPSGVAYTELTSKDIVVLSLSSGEVLAGEGRPSSDTPTHLYLYRKFSGLGGSVHLGPSAGKALENAAVLEAAAGMTFHAGQLDDVPEPLPGYLLDKHYLRKQGSGAYYGQG